jgi:quercetin dioxygenase-like cupin family protein
MFTSRAATVSVPMLPGVERRTLVHGEKTLLAEFALKKGFAIPLHSHPHEQTGYLVSGRLRFTVGGETIDARPGDGWCVCGGVEHGVDILEDSIAIEVFSPVRDDYLPADK